MGKCSLISVAVSEYGKFRMIKQLGLLVTNCLDRLDWITFSVNPTMAR